MQCPSRDKQTDQLLWLRSNEQFDCMDYLPQWQCKTVGRLHSRNWWLSIVPENVSNADNQTSHIHACGMRSLRDNNKLLVYTVWARLTYVNVLHWIVGNNYYGFLVNEGICLILVIHTLYPSSLSVLYNKDFYPTSSIVWHTTFSFYIFKSH